MPTRYRLATFALRLLLGTLFLWAGLSKLGSPLQNLATIYSYQIVLPDTLAQIIAHTLPWFEILLGLALLTASCPPITLASTAVLLLAFTALTAQAWWRELPIDCGCVDLSILHPSLAILSTPGGATARNLALLAATALLATLQLRPRPATNSLSAPPA